MPAPTLTVQLPSFASYPAWPLQDWRQVLDWARAAEGAGIDRLAVVDHVVNGVRGAEQYHWGDYTVAPATPYLEPLTLLGVLAGVTSTIRLSTRILIAPLRPAALLAKTAATVDVISGGRLDLGVGTGWQREEYEAEGLDFSARGRLLTETMAACRALWGQAPASFRSAVLDFSDVYCSPAPLQARLPVWFGGTLHPINFERITSLGDGWIPIMNASVTELTEGAARLAAFAATSDRAPFTVQAALDLSGGSLARAMDEVPRLVAAGGTDILVNLAAASPERARAIEVIAEIGRRFEHHRAAGGTACR